MKVFVLGGYGKTGLPVVDLLAQQELVTKIAIAGRHGERAEQAAHALGEKAVAVQVDGTDEAQLTAHLAGYDLVVNVAYQKTILPAIRAAARTGTDYCDVVAWGEMVDQVLQQTAEVRGITAIIAVGISPCISNLMAVHMARQLDEVAQLQIGRADVFDFGTGHELTPQDWHKPLQARAAALHAFKGFFTYMLQTQQKDGLRTILECQDGRWVRVDPIHSGVVIPRLDSGTVVVRPYASTGDPFGTLPTGIAQAPPVQLAFSPLPPQLHAVLREQVLHMLAGEMEVETAVNAFYSMVEDNRQHWLSLPDDYIPIPKLWVRALGTKNGRAARSTSWFTPPMWNVGGYYLTSVALAAAALNILHGEVQPQGVIPAEKAFDPLTFMDDVAALLPKQLPDGKMVDESFEWLA